MSEDLKLDKEPLTLNEWLEQTAPLRAKLYAYGKSPLPLESGERHIDFDEAIQNGDDAGRLVADMDNFLSQHTAQQTLAIKKKYPDNSVDERKILVKDAVRELQLLRDGLAVTQRTIRDRIFTNQNENRSRA